MEFLLNPEFKIYVHSSWLNQQSHVCFEYKKSLQILYSTSMEAYFQKYIQFFLHAVSIKALLQDNFPIYKNIQEVCFNFQHQNIQGDK